MPQNNKRFVKIFPSFWISPMGKKIKELGTECQIIAWYLRSSPHSNMIGIYYLPISFINHETGIPFEGASKALQSLIEVDFCSYDYEQEYIWVREMAYEENGKLKASDNRVKSIQDIYANLPKLGFLSAFYDKYSNAFHLENKEESESPLEGPSEPLRSQNKNKNKKQNKKDICEVETSPCAHSGEINSNNNTQSEIPQEHQHKTDAVDSGSQFSSTTNRGVAGHQKSNEVHDLFQYWKEVLGHPRARLDKKRESRIVQALKSYSIQDLKQAIDGCTKTPYNMGENDRHQRYDDIDLILRDASRIERFINNAINPPVKTEMNDSANDPMEFAI